MTLDWEYFIRLTFGFKYNNGKPVMRGGDPANLASSDLFNERHFYDMLILTGYAFEILNQDVKNRTVAVSDETQVMLDSYIVQILSATSIGEIEEIVNSYKDSVFNKFFKYDGKVMTRK